MILGIDLIKCKMVNTTGNDNWEKSPTPPILERHRNDEKNSLANRK